MPISANRKSYATGPDRAPDAEEPSMNLLRTLTAHRLLAIVRAPSGDHLMPTLQALIEGGVRCLEITLPTPGSLRAVSSLRSRYDDEVAVGVGTVLTATDVRQAAEAGAEFVVSPHTDTAIMSAAAELGVEALPGVFTPTEAVNAWERGAVAAKLFPASVLGPRFVAAMRAPLPHLPFVATGGVGLDDVGGWLGAGALAVAVGSPLTGDAPAGGDLTQLRKRTQAYVAAVRRSGGV